MKSDNYVVIQGWMCNELGLKGNELLVFALIYGFSQDGESRFSGSRGYIAETFNISLPTVDKALKSLVDKELLEEHKIYMNGVQFNEYKTLYPVKKLYRGCKETLHNKTSNKQIDNKNFNSKKQELKLEDSGKDILKHSKTVKTSLYSKCLAQIDSRNYNTDLHNALVDYLKVRLQIKDKPLYENSWKGLLNKLDRDFSKSERLQVVYQSIERGYASFFPVSSIQKKSKPWEENVTSEGYTEEEKRELEEWQEDMRKQGIKVDF